MVDAATSSPDIPKRRPKANTLTRLVSRSKSDKNSNTKQVEEDNLKNVSAELSFSGGGGGGSRRNGSNRTPAKRLNSGNSLSSSTFPSSPLTPTPSSTPEDPFENYLASSSSYQTFSPQKKRHGSVSGRRRKNSLYISGQLAGLEGAEGKDVVAVPRSRSQRSLQKIFDSVAPHQPYSAALVDEEQDEEDPVTYADEDENSQDTCSITEDSEESGIVAFSGTDRAQTPTSSTLGMWTPPTNHADKMGLPVLNLGLVTGLGLPELGDLDDIKIDTPTTDRRGESESGECNTHKHQPSRSHTDSNSSSSSSSSGGEESARRILSPRDRWRSPRAETTRRDTEDVTFLSSSPSPLADMHLVKTKLAARSSVAMEEENGKTSPATKGRKLDATSVDGRKGKSPREMFSRRPSLPAGLVFAGKKCDSPSPLNGLDDKRQMRSTSNGNLSAAVQPGIPNKQIKEHVARNGEKEKHHKKEKKKDEKDKQPLEPLRDSSPKKQRHARNKSAKETREQILIEESESSSSPSDPETNSGEHPSRSSKQNADLAPLYTSHSAPASANRGYPSSPISITRATAAQPNRKGIARSPEAIELSSDNETDDFSAGSNDDSGKETSKLKRGQKSIGPRANSHPGLASPIAAARNRRRIWDKTQGQQSRQTIIADGNRKTPNPLSPRSASTDKRGAFARSVVGQASFDLSNLAKLTPPPKRPKGMGWEETPEDARDRRRKRQHQQLAEAIGQAVTSSSSSTDQGSSGSSTPRDRKWTFRDRKLARTTSLTALESYLYYYSFSRLMPELKHRKSSVVGRTHYLGTNNSKTLQKERRSDRTERKEVERRRTSRKNSKENNVMAAEGHEMDPWTLLMSNDQLFLQELFNQNLQLLGTLCSLAAPTGEELESLCPAVIRLFEANGNGIQLMKWAIQLEVSSTTDRYSLFRQDSLAPRFIGAYAQMQCHDYLVATLKPCIRKICSTKRSFEINPARQQLTEKERQKTLQKVRDLCQSIVDAVLDSRSSCPATIELLAYYLNQEVSEKFGDAGLSCISTFYFLRFLLPAVVAPYDHHVVKSAPTEEAGQALKLAAKTLQTMANNLRFEQNQYWLMPLNEFIESNYKQVDDFLRSLIKAPPGEHAARKIRGNDALSQSAPVHAISSTGLNHSKVEEIVEKEGASLQHIRHFCMKHRKRFAYGALS